MLVANKGNVVPFVCDCRPDLQYNRTRIRKHDGSAAGKGEGLALSNGNVIPTWFLLGTFLISEKDLYVLLDIVVGKNVTYALFEDREFCLLAAVSKGYD